MITREQHLLIKLSEECSEVGKEVSKALLFGLDDKEPNQDLTNREKIIAEFNDLFAVMSMLKDDGVFDESKLLTADSLIAKREKVEKWIKYSQSVEITSL